jgi:hypothetical protein
MLTIKEQETKVILEMAEFIENLRDMVAEQNARAVRAEQECLFLRNHIQDLERQLYGSR